MIEGEDGCFVCRGKGARNADASGETISFWGEADSSEVDTHTNGFAEKESKQRMARASQF